MQPVKLHGQPEENSVSLCSHQGEVSNPEKTLKPSDQKSLCGPLSLFDSPLTLHRCTSSRTHMTPPQEAFPRFHIRKSSPHSISQLHIPQLHQRCLAHSAPYTPPAGSSSDLPSCQRLLSPAGFSTPGVHGAWVSRSLTCPRPFQRFCAPFLKEVPPDGIHDSGPIESLPRPQ